jgi:pimeloyl-ACP methyl ester carboxylesterase
MKNRKKIHVYFMPGMAANNKIFNLIKLDDPFEKHLLSWFIPIKDESLSEYSKRMCKKIKHSNPVLVGVSFGGILVQEMSKIIPCDKVIIISSIRTNKELPVHMLLTKKTKAYRFFPLKWIDNFEDFVGFVFGPTAKKRMDLNKKYLSFRSPEYLIWSLEKMFNWKQTKPLPGVIHIHGTYDMVFPIIYLKNYIPIPKGTHVMILRRYKWFNKNLPSIILNEKFI